MTSCMGADDPPRGLELRRFCIRCECWLVVVLVAVITGLIFSLRCLLYLVRLNRPHVVYYCMGVLSIIEIDTAECGYRITIDDIRLFLWKYVCMCQRKVLYDWLILY